jgi:hypothetical protein
VFLLTGTAVIPAPAAITSASNSAARVGTTINAKNSSGSTIAARTLINLYNDAGTLTMRLADTTVGGPGYVGSGFTTASVASLAIGPVQLDGILAGFSGLTSGQYYSDPTTPGAITTTLPTAAGAHLQKIGFAVSSTELFIRIGNAVKLS